MNDIWNKVIENAIKSLDSNDVPVGAVLVINNKIIAEGYNTRELDHNVLGHAEINVIKTASEKLENWNLSECELYVSLKPCNMCMEIIKQSRIKKVHYLLDKPSNKLEFDKTELSKSDSYQQKKQYQEILSGFFQKLRENKQ